MPLCGPSGGGDALGECSGGDSEARDRVGAPALRSGARRSCRGFASESLPLDAADELSDDDALLLSSSLLSTLHSSCLLRVDGNAATLPLTEARDRVVCRCSDTFVVVADAGAADAVNVAAAATGTSKLRLRGVGVAEMAAATTCEGK